VPAERDQFLPFLPFPPRAALRAAARDGLDQRHGVGRGEHGEVEVVAGERPCERGPAGDNRRRAGARRQQRRHLGGVQRVVQEQQHAPPEEPLAVERGGGGGVLRDVLARGAQGGEQQPPRLGHLERRVARVGAAQVDVEQAVGEAVGDLVGGADGERGLADAAGAVDQADGGGGQRVGEPATDAGELDAARHEGGDGGREGGGAG
jgi:hypothetical protein